MPKIVCLSGANADYEYELPEGDFEVTMGRSDENDICVMDRKSSRFHCKIHFHDGELSLEDLNSTNGLKINNKPVNGKLTIDYGDFIGIGNTVFTVLDNNTGDFINPYDSTSSVIFSRRTEGKKTRFETTNTTTFRRIKTEQTGNRTGFLTFFEKKEGNGGED